jgi:hypothetical protein
VPKEVFKVVVPTCALAREGLEALEAAVLAAAGAPELAAGGVSWAVNERQAEALVRAHEALMRVSGRGEGGGGRFGQKWVQLYAGGPRISPMERITLNWWVIACRRTGSLARGKPLGDAWRS